MLPSNKREFEMSNAISWFEIPVADMDRAQRFYETLFHRPLRREAMGPETTLAVFEYEPGTSVGGYERFRAKSDTEPSRFQHVEVVGTVADG